MGWWLLVAPGLLTCPFALAAARGLFEQEGLEAREIASRAMKIAADICIYTNENVVLESL